ncbi:MAG TPA: serine hydrolase domain-containing protein [Allosphingosinicella sp.]|nr:serine hydrolase domain-containing protein [Allosphingosinicella sp.]
MRFLTLLPFFGLSACQTFSQESSPSPPSQVTYAWATFSADKELRSGASGVADRRSGRLVTVDDPARVASVSKLIVALGVMRLVEQGRVDLDTDVSGWLGWQLRNPAFPNVPITLRRLLSHTSSLQDAGEAYVIPLGSTVRGAVSDAKVYDRGHAPGTFFRYSNLNFPIIASALEKATGERFDRLIHGLVLKPLGLDACFNWTMCSDSKVARAVTLYRPDGSVALDDLQGKQPPCPVFRRGTECDLDRYELGSNGALFSPQGGLRASVRDLAVIGQLLLNGGRHRGRPFLSKASIDTILTPVWRFNGSNGDTTDGFYCAYGLAAQSLPVRVTGCKDDLLRGRRFAGHAGEAYNLRSGLWIDPRRKVGIAYFAANNPADPPAGRSAYRAIEEWLAARIDD